METCDIWGAYLPNLTKILGIIHGENINLFNMDTMEKKALIFFKFALGVNEKATNLAVIKRRTG